MLDPARLTIGMIALFGGLFLIMLVVTYFACDRKLKVALAIVGGAYAGVTALVFFIVAVVAWSFDTTIWEVLT